MRHVFDIVLFSVVDPGQQLNQLMQSTMKAASHGLQHLFQTTKDVIKTLQAETVSIWALVSAAVLQGSVCGCALHLLAVTVANTSLTTETKYACADKSQLGSLLETRCDGKVYDKNLSLFSSFDI